MSENPLTQMEWHVLEYVRQNPRLGTDEAKDRPFASALRSLVAKGILEPLGDNRYVLTAEGQEIWQFED